MSTPVWEAVPAVEGTLVYITDYWNVLMADEVRYLSGLKPDGRTKAGKQHKIDLANLDVGMKALSDLAWSLGLNGPEELFRK